MMNEKHHNNSGGFWVGLVIGAMVGAIAHLASSNEEGKKKIHQLLEKGEGWVEELEGKKKFDLTPHFDNEIMDDRVEKIKVTANNLKKRFFSKHGKKLSFFW